MLDEVIPCSDRHELRPNGAGDYELSCPDGGARQGFIPYMFAISAHSLGLLECDNCRKMVAAERPRWLDELAAQRTSVYTEVKNDDGTTTVYVTDTRTP